MGLNWNVPRWQFVADFYLVPLYIAATLATAFTLATPQLDWLGYFVAGLLAWTLVEYSMHRFLFHTVYWREHGAHHAWPLKWIGVAPWFTGAGFLVLYLATVQSLDGIGRGGVAFAGYLVGYYAYIGIHWLIHHTASPLVAKLRAAHELHHKGVDANFGVSTNLWDHVFRSYVRPA